jgi:hypothetical protein
MHEAELLEDRRTKHERVVTTCTVEEHGGQCSERRGPDQVRERADRLEKAAE